MLLVVVILLVAFILVPLIDLTLKEQALFFAKLLVYVGALVFILWALFVSGGHLPLSAG
jgi:hypothetical protein